MTRTELLALHAETTQSCLAIMRAKQHDYTADSDDPFANFRMAQMIGLDPVSGLLLRVLDKIKRIQTFTEKGVLAVKEESVEDACDDIVNYAILCKGLLREKRQNAQVTVPQVMVMSDTTGLPTKFAGPASN